MDRLSIELIRMIYSLLKPRDVGRLRRVSKFYEIVGRPFMFRLFHLVFTPNSFERLRLIYSNPDLAPHVTYLYYEPDSFESCDAIEKQGIPSAEPEPFSETNSHLSDSDSLSEPDESTSYGDSIEEGEIPSAESEPSSETNSFLSDSDSLSESDESTGYQKLLEYSKQQEAMCKDNHYASKVADAIYHLPNLYWICMSIQHTAPRPTNALRKAFRDSVVVPFGHHSCGEPYGVSQMLSLLQGVARSQAKLKRLFGGVMDWKLFKQSEEVLKDLQKALQNIQYLELEFSTCLGREEAIDLISSPFDFERDELASKIQGCAACLKDGRFNRILATAPNLRRLDVRFYSAIPTQIPGIPADLSNIVGKHKWEFLAEVTLGFMSSKEEDLVGFCELHAMTLESLVISRIILIKGSWLSTFQTMRRLLCLKDVSIYDRLEAVGECWDFPMMGAGGKRCETTMRREVQEYLLQGGDGPLLDLNRYIDLNKGELKEVGDIRGILDGNPWW